MAGPVGVYISIPFCKAKCTFCNFASGAFGAERMEPYLDRLCGEIRGARAAAEGMGASLPRMVDSIYLGGGTPSLLTGLQSERVFRCLREEFDVAADAEITLECAPGQLAEETLEELLRQGMNRVSFGVQSFVDKESAAVGRLHTRQQCKMELERVRAAGIEEVSLDLIAGLPHQTKESWMFSVEQAIASGVPHVSVYLLEVDDDSRLGREVLEQGSRYGAAAVPKEDETAEWYLKACARLGAAGLEQYEISNFARTGHRSRHNLKYWQRRPYVGFGLDAHSMLEREDDAVRFANPDELDAYLAGDGTGQGALRLLRDAKPDVDVIGRDAAFEETLFLGLRLNDGVDLGCVRERFGETMVRDARPAIEEVRDAGLVELEGTRLRLTARGRLVSNEVFSRLLTGQEAGAGVG